MSQTKFEVPSEVIDLPSKGLVYAKENPMSSGNIEMYYMTAKTEDILTNVNLLRQGLAIEKMLKSLIKTELEYDELTIGDRNGLLIASRILGYGKDYSFSYKNPTTGEVEKVTVDLQDLKYKEVDFTVFKNTNEIYFQLPHSKNELTFKILTVADDKKIDQEIKGVKKALGQDQGQLSTKLKHQITSVNGDSTLKTIREFVDSGALLSRDSIALRKYIAQVTPDIDTTIQFTLSDGTEVNTDLPMGAEFFFPDLD
jgi:hypothetical protein